MNLTETLYLVAAQSDAGPLPPPVPTRDQILALKLNFQGYDVPGIPGRVWEPQIPSYTSEQRQRIYAYKRAHGDTHINLTLNLGGLDTLDFILDAVQEALEAGFYCLLMCMGDGNGRSDEPNYDPGAKGWYWLMANFQTIHDRVASRGLKPYVIFCPGYDGVVPGWQPFTRVNQYVQMARSVVGNDGYLALELSSGYWCWTGEEDDWATPDGKKFDMVLWEGPIDFGPDNPPPDEFCTLPDDVRAPYDQIWQVSKRLLGPKWNRPADMPACDDPGMFHGGPSAFDTPRGPFAVVAFEWDTYKRVRLGQLTDAQVQAHADYLRACGYSLVCWT